MTWVRLDDKRALNAKLRRAGLAARGLDEAAICWSAHQEHDGFVSEEDVAMLTNLHGCKKPKPLIDVLVQVGRWERVPGGYQLAGFLEFNPSRADLEARREADRKRKRSRHGVPPDSERNPEGADADSVAPSRPVPTRPDEEPPQPPRTAGGRSTPRSRGESPRQLASADADRERRERQVRQAREFGRQRAVIHATEVDAREEFEHKFPSVDERDEAMAGWREVRAELTTPGENVVQIGGRDG